MSLPRACVPLLLNKDITFPSPALLSDVVHTAAYHEQHFRRLHVAVLSELHILPSGRLPGGAQPLQLSRQHHHGLCEQLLLWVPTLIRLCCLAHGSFFVLPDEEYFHSFCAQGRVNVCCAEYITTASYNEVFGEQLFQKMFSAVFIEAHVIKLYYAMQL